MSVAVGQRLGGRYVLEHRLAVGGMGEVWEAHDEVLGRRVAAKVLRDPHVGDPTSAERFRAEARHTAALSHPGIAGVYDYGEVDGTAYLVMELVDGEPLSALLARQGRLPPARTLDVVAQAAFALQAAHEAGVVHRDVKPGNLLVRDDGVVKVTDFGIARSLDSAALTRTGTVVGTAHYLSPEQVAGRAAGPASDVYALGTVAYECLAGHRPFAGDTPIAVALAHQRDTPPPLPTDVPDAVRALVERCLAKDPAQRPADAGELGRAALALRDRLTDRAAVVGSAAAPEPAVAAATAVEPLQVIRPAPSQRRVRNTLLLVGVGIVVLGALLLRACAATSTVHVPPVTGEQLGAATAALHRVGLQVAHHDAHDATRPAGTVLRQQPAADAPVDSGSTVTLTVSSGPRTVHVDPASYVGQPYAQVQAALTAAGLHVVRATAASGQPPGTVVSVQPAGDLTEGALVTVTVATAPPPAPASTDTGPAPGAGHGGDKPGKGNDNGHGKGHG